MSQSEGENPSMSSRDLPSSPTVAHRIAQEFEEESHMGCGCGDHSSMKRNYESNVHEVRSNITRYIYATGKVEARFPNPSIEKEFSQIRGRIDTAGLTDRQVLYSVLSERQNRYLARHICWVFTVEGLETYILQPREPSDIDLLIEALKPSPRPTFMDVVVGVRGPMSTRDMCNGLIVPIVMFDSLYSIDIDTLIKSIPKSKDAGSSNNNNAKFNEAAEELFWRVKHMTGNRGSTDENRALNYLVVRYPAIYQRVADSFAANASLTNIVVQPSGLSESRNILNVIFSFTNRKTDVVEKYFARVDVTEEFPFLVTPLSPYYDI